MQTNYNQSDKQSIIDYAANLKDKSLRDLLDPNTIDNFYGGKGSFGQFVEEHYFGYKINSVSEPDFKEVGMELKCSPLKEIKNGDYRAKERLVLNMINYINVVNESFETSSFWNKNANILLIFYLYEKEKLPFDYIIKLVDEWNFSAQDLDVIKNDWLTITNKIKAGKAHELSEGDTFYLGACTKGANASSVREQPFSDIPAKQRAFSFKTGYVNHIIASISGGKQGYGKLLENRTLSASQNLEDYILSKFEKYKNKSINQIIEALGIELNPKAKNFTASLTNALLGIELDKKIEEFEKAELIVKTVRLKENNLPKEDISFPTFKYTELVKEEWEDSDFKDILEHKFLFIFLKYKGDELYFEKAQFWNMNYEHRVEAKRVWEKTKEIIVNGDIVKGFKTNKNGVTTRETNFPSKKNSFVAHVRPHAQNADDTYPLPIPDQFSGYTDYTKHCFWLNASYVRDEIYLK
ncbi:Sau3AI family type II restriction endonuclease [Empedobacter falsenii]|uniref:Sau3AI family type II restriction endonuclease n=1 Tax=Empedobacter falsenii TaxID=343874 RepID=UPI003A807EAB